MATIRQQLLDLIDRLSPEMERAFLDAVSNIKSDIVIKEVIEALEKRDVEAAIRALHIDTAAFRGLSDAVRQAFNEGGNIVVTGMPKTLTDIFSQRIVIRWDGSNQRAEQIIREQAVNAIENIAETTRQSARDVILAGFQEGQGPRAIAVELAGRKDRVTGKRDGGILGMTSQQAEYIRSARAILSDPERIKEYLSEDRATGKLKAKYSKTDKRYIASIAKAIREGRALEPEKIDKLIIALSNSYIRLRAENVARMETGQAVTNSQHEANQQMLDKTGRDPALMERVWKTAGDGRVRHSHANLNSTTMRGMDEPFQTILGNLMRFPMDSRFGASLDDKAGCRCICLYNFNYAEAFARSRGR